MKKRLIIIICFLKLTVVSLFLKFVDFLEDIGNFLAEQENVLSNAEMLLKKRGELIDQCSKNNIISKGEKCFDAPKKSEESIPDKSKQKYDQSIPNGC